jgi:hypothetical protein
MGRGGLEPPTHGFSVPDSINSPLKTLEIRLKINIILTEMMYLYKN